MTKEIYNIQRQKLMDDAQKLLDEGRVSGFGTHDELLKSSPIYQEIYQSQQEGVGE